MLNENLECLKREYNDLHEILTNYKEKDKYKLEQKNNFYNIVFENRYLHSRYNPKVEAEKWVDSLNVGDKDTLLIIGLGLGYYMEPLLKKYSSKKIIIVEPNEEVFLKFLKIQDARSYIEDKNIVFLVGKKTITIRNIFSEYLTNNKIKNVFCMELPIYKKIYPEYIKELYSDLSKIILLLRGNLGTNIEFGKMWIYNILRNIKHTSKYSNINCLENKLKGIPAVIVSAGPSLEKNMHLLKGIYDKAIIIAAGTAAAILDSNGIEPHIIMGIDGSKEEAAIFRSLKNQKPVLIYDQKLHFEVAETYRGDKLWITTNNNKVLDGLFKKLSYEYTSIATGGSVANTALVFSDWLNSNPILFVGQDLAYTNEKLYASGSNHQTDTVTKEGYIEAEDIYGNRINTKKSFIIFKDWFEDYVKLVLKNKDVYNCTEGGLKIEGIPNIEFKTAIDKYCNKKYDIKSILEREIKSSETIKVDLIENMFKEYGEQAEVCIKLCKKRLEIIYNIFEKKLYDNKFDKEINRALELTDKIEDMEFYDIVIKNTGQVYIETITQGVNGQLQAIHDIKEKRRVLLLGLLKQYKFAYECCEVAKLAIEKKEALEIF